MPSSTESSQPNDQTQVSRIAGRLSTFGVTASFKFLLMNWIVCRPPPIPVLKS